jgi:hypothetical protein
MGRTQIAAISITEKMSSDMKELLTRFISGSTADSEAPDSFGEIVISAVLVSFSVLFFNVASLLIALIA